MYLEHYQLHTKPFQITTDPKFLWLGDNHKEALATLKYGILDNKGFLLITGDVGTGKTTLINALIESLGEDVVVATVPDPNLKPIEFFNYISNSFGLKNKFATKGDFLFNFHNFLKSTYKNNKRVLLVIDEAQRSNHELLEEIRLLSNIELKNTKLLNVFFVGQNEFNDLLWENRNRALRQRITVNYNVYPLGETETAKYIEHRLEIAGSKRRIFTKSATKEIMLFSRGFPRTINIICDHALLTGYVRGTKKIDSKIVRECAEDLQIPKLSHKEESIPEPVRSSKKYKIEFSQHTVVYAGLIILLLIITGAFLSDKITKGSFSSVEKQLKQHISEMQTQPEMSNKASDQNENPPKTGNTVKASTNAILKNEKQEGPVKATNQLNTETTLEKETKSKKEKPVFFNKPVDYLNEKLIIYFAHNSNELTENVIKSLDEIGLTLKKNPDWTINVVGYTDTSGVYSYNKSISRFRANIIKSYLEGKGVKSNQIKAIGMGPSNPVGDNSTLEGRRSNRRVEIIFN